MRSLRKKALVVLAAAVIAVAMAQSVAFAGLINEYGMSFAGQDKCLECHDGTYGQTIHGRFATVGLTPSAPTSWTVFRAAGDPHSGGDKSAGGLSRAALGSCQNVRISGVL